MEKYYTAITYKNWERVGEPFSNDKGKLCTKVKQKCDRCTNGVYAAGVENGHIKPHPEYNGVCLKCNGVGYVVETVRLYTEKEFNSMERQKERVAERRLEEAEKVEQEKRAKAGEVKANWLLENGFNETGVTYVYIADDSYNRKDELKAAGWRYHALIGWHIGEVNVPHNEEDIYILDADTAAEFNMYGDGNWKYTVKDIIAEAKVSLKAQSRSEWVGLEKEKITDLPVVLKKVSGYQARFGWSNIYTFMNGDNIIVWFTSSNPHLEVEQSYLLSATIKTHSEFRGEKQTIITRAKVKEI
jgi:hypothetical protein